MLEEKRHTKTEWRFIKDIHYLWTKRTTVLQYSELCNNVSSGNLAGGLA
jgi:hypothetical protein